MTPARVGTPYADTTSMSGAENLTYQICGLAQKSQAVSMSFSLNAVWVDGTIVTNNPVSYVDPQGLFAIGVAVGAFSGAVSGYAGAYKQSNGNIGEGILGGSIGLLLGGAVGAVDPSEGLGTLALIGALSGELGDVSGQLIGCATRTGVSSAKQNFGRRLVVTANSSPLSRFYAHAKPITAARPENPEIYPRQDSPRA